MEVFIELSLFLNENLLPLILFQTKTCSVRTEEKTVWAEKHGKKLQER